jgi:RNA polymerase subunit RPABC4/transcription elongation factor Spt4
MGTFTCRDCNNQVSRSAYSCPHCGNTRVREQIRMQEWQAEVLEQEKAQKYRAKKYYNGNVDEMIKVEKAIEEKVKKRQEWRNWWRSNVKVGKWWLFNIGFLSSIVLVGRVQEQCGQTAKSIIILVWLALLGGMIYYLKKYEKGE